MFWTSREKEKIVSRAVDIQSDRPDLAGLPLLRAAMTAIPAERRRKLIAVTQAPWFEEGVAREIRSRKSRSRAEAGADVKTRLTQIEYRQDAAINLLSEMLRELRSLNEKFTGDCSSRKCYRTT
ncbi:hypothetical protein [Singulisphaera sp. GP187]|uniref:hypothetical protein n=1 Tax=Singulisphaera sp. GP187 TaxID=1882752 RepID=UPI001160E90B|nr:hypothetical protein [Singulisphaera sp. GP187]